MAPSAEAPVKPVDPELREVAPEPASRGRTALAGDPPATAFRDLLGQSIGLRVDAVTRVFQAGEVAVRALDGVSCEIAPGEFVAITGPSGCGKSTLLGLLGGLDRPSSGHVFAAGTALDQLSPGELDDYRLLRVGTVFQAPNLLPALSARDNVAMPMTLAGVAREERTDRAGRLLELVGLGHRGRLRPSRLSGGEQQRTAVARALANRPGLVLADEPTGNLDTATAERVLGLLEEVHRRGVTLVLVTHDPEVARRAERVIRLRDGCLVPGPGFERRTARAPVALGVPARLGRREAVRLGLGGAGRRPLRTGLTVAGVAIGIGVMCLILALAAGIQREVAGTARGGALVAAIEVQAPPAGHHLDPAAVAGLTALPGVRAGWGSVAIQGTLAPAEGTPAPGAAVLLSLPPAPPPPPPSSSYPGGLLAGRAPPGDHAAETVLTAVQAQRLGWSARQAVGKRVQFRGRFPGLAAGPAEAPAQLPLELVVVGVSRGALTGGGAEGGQVPYAVANRYWLDMAQANGWTQDQFTSITLVATSFDQLGRVREGASARGYLVTTGDGRLRAALERLRALDLALLGLAALALLVAGLGIANTMYSAVRERTHEVGVLRALGARSRDVTRLFVVEAGLIGVLAGLLGVAGAGLLGAAGSSLINRVAPTQGGDLGPQLFPAGPAIAAGGLLLAVALSLLSGLLPARRAAALDPALALRRD